MTTATRTKPAEAPTLAEAHQKAKLLAQRDAIDHEIRQREAADLFERRKSLAAEYSKLGCRDDDPEIATAREAKSKLDIAKENLELATKEYLRADGRCRQYSARQVAFRDEAKRELEASCPVEISAAIADLQQRINDALSQQRRDVAFDPENTTSNYSSIEQFVAKCRSAIQQLSPLRLEATEPKQLTKAIADILSRIPEPNFEQVTNG